MNQFPAGAQNSAGRMVDVAPVALIGTNGDPVAQSNPLPVDTGFIVTVAANLTRPANTTAYAAGDAITDTGGAAIAITVSDVNNQPVSIERLRLSTSDTGPGTSTISVEVYLYTTAPTPAADNAPFTFPIAGFIGRVSGSFMLASDGSVATLIPATGSRIITVPASGTKVVYAIMKTLTAFTPSANSTVIAHTIEGFQGRA